MANPNPSPATRFQPGNTMGGKTSKQKKLEYEAAEMAAEIRHKMLSDITELLKGDDGGEDDAKGAALGFIKSDVLKLIKDSEDRAHGTPKQTVAGDPDAPLLPIGNVTWEVHDPKRDND